MNNCFMSCHVLVISRIHGDNLKGLYLIFQGRTAWGRQAAVLTLRFITTDPTVTVTEQTAI
jgi:hypothetical protein